MEFNLDRVRDNVRQATTEDLLDRVTVYRTGLEPEALPLVLEELRSRGVTAEAVVAHEESRRALIVAGDAVAQKCSLCRRPAVTRKWGWHRLFGKLPVFPRPLYLCEIHQTKSGSVGGSADPSR
jgi:hypothetical protein